MLTKNTDIRIKINEAGVTCREVARELGILNTSFSRLLNNEDMRPSRKRAILEAIDRVAERKARINERKAGGVME